MKKILALTVLSLGLSFGGTASAANGMTASDWILTKQIDTSNVFFKQCAYTRHIYMNGMYMMPQHFLGAAWFFCPFTLPSSDINGY